MRKLLLRVTRRISAGLFVGLPASHKVSILAAMILLGPAAMAIAAEYQSLPTDDIWVYSSAGDPTGDPLLKAWGHDLADGAGPRSIAPNYPWSEGYAPPGYSDQYVHYWGYTYVRWDVSSIPSGAYQVQEATVTVTHQMYPSFTLDQGLKSPLEARAIEPYFSEATWSYDDPNNKNPGGRFGMGDLSAYQTTSRFPILISLLQENSFEDHFSAAVNDPLGRGLALSFNSAMESGDYGGPQMLYRFYSKEAGDGTYAPRLKVRYALKPLRVGEAKATKYPVGAKVLLENKVVTAEFQSAWDMVYVADSDRSSGIGVKLNGTISGLQPGDMVTIEGVTALWNSSEIGIEAISVTKTGSGDHLKPLYMNNKATGGGALGNQPAIAGASGLNNAGMLVRTTGTVSGSNPSFQVPFGPNVPVFWIDDGSGVVDGFQNGDAIASRGIAVLAPNGTALPPSGHVAVTGILRAISGPAGPARLLVATEVD